MFPDTDPWYPTTCTSHFKSMGNEYIHHITNSGTRCKEEDGLPSQKTVKDVDYIQQENA